MRWFDSILMKYHEWTCFRHTQPFGTLLMKKDVEYKLTLAEIVKIGKIYPFASSFLLFAYVKHFINYLT